MQAKLVQEGRSIDYTPSAAVAAGQLIVIGGLVGVASVPIASGALGAIAVDGVFDLAKESDGGPVFAAGEDVAFDLVNELAVKPGTSGSVRIGPAIAAAAADDATVRVRLVADELAPCMFDRAWEAVDLTSASKTLDAQDVGKVLNVTGSDTYVVTLPATAAGVEYVIRAAADGLLVAVSPNGSDKIMGADLAGADDTDRLLAAATARAGDYVHLRADGSAGWYIVAARGVWSNAA